LNVLYYKTKLKTYIFTGEALQTAFIIVTAFQYKMQNIILCVQSSKTYCFLGPNDIYAIFETVPVA